MLKASKKERGTGHNMKTPSTTVAAVITGLAVWLLSMAVNVAVAGDHYRIGTLNQSRHYREDDELNETHNGVYLVHNRNVYGTYYNSEYQQSFFYARNHPINEVFSYSYGVAIGYNAGLLPMLAMSAQLSVLKLTLTPEAAVVGFEFPLL